MTGGRQGIRGAARGGRPRLALALAGLLFLAVPPSVPPKLSSAPPPPIPPASVPEPPAGPAMNLAPPSGPASIPNLPPPLTQPAAPIAAVPPVAPPPGVAVPSQGVLALTARFGKDLPPITGG